MNNQKKRVRELKKGELFVLDDLYKPDRRFVFVRGEYDRGYRMYKVLRLEHIEEDTGNPYWSDGNRIVYAGFTL